MARAHDLNSSLPTISLVTCSYQQGRYLQSTIRSVIDQNYASLEYIVIDGGSVDGSVEVIKRHQHALAFWVSEPDEGQTDALIKGFARSRGEIMGWLCSDDLLLPGALQMVGEFFRAHPEVLAVYGNALWIDAHGALIRPKREIAFSRFIFLYAHNYLPQPSVFWRRSLYERVGGLDKRFNCAMDTDLFDRFSRVTDLAHIPRYVSCMRYYPEQKTRSLSAQSRAEDEAIRHRYSPHRRLRAVYPVLHVAARISRVTRRALIGAYHNDVSDEHLEWLRQYATPGV